MSNSRIKFSEFEHLSEIPENGIIPIVADGKNYTISANSLIGDNNQQSPTNLSNYLQLSGGNITGDLVITGKLSALEYSGILGADDTLVSTKVRASSANWDNSYTTVLSNSASWGNGSDDTLVSTKVRASSANWDNTYNTVRTLSTGWTGTYDDTLVSTKVRASSANWDNTYNTVRTLSTGWSGTYDDTLVSTKVRASSANWDNTYNTVRTLSTGWTGKVSSDVTGILGASIVTNVVSIPLSSYQALGSYSDTTFYIIT